MSICIRRVFLLLMIVFVAGCTTTHSMIDSAQPLTVKADGPRLGIAKLVVAPDLLDKKIGARTQGLINIPIEYYYGSKLLEPSGAYPNAVAAELQEAGHSVPQENDGIFASGTSGNGDAAEYLIGGNIIDASFISHDSLGGVKSEASVEIEWKVLDTRSQSVVFEKLATGKAKGPKDSATTLVTAVRASIREVLADPVFLRALGG